MTAPSAWAGTIGTAAGTGSGGYGGDGGPAVNAALNYPIGVATDSAGNLFITSGERVRKVAPDGTIGTVAGNGTSGYSGDNGPAVGAQLRSPAGVAVDVAGDLYIADYGNNCVRKVTPGGTISTVAGNGAKGFSGDGGAATNAQLNLPSGVAIDGTGALYIADTANSRVRKVTADGAISTVAGNGTQGYAGDGGPAINARLNFPNGVAVDGAGNLYIADTGNERVRKVAPDGTISTVAGFNASGYAGDGGLASYALLNFPLGVAVDRAGNLFIADSGNNRVRKVSLDGTINTEAGNGIAGYGGDGGPATSAKLNQPSGAAIDSAGNLYIADSLNNRVRKVAGPVYTVGGSVSGLAGSGLVLSLNGAQTLQINANGGFVFPTPLAAGADYSVSVRTQPASPTQTCFATNSSGTVIAADITNIVVACITPVATTTALNANPSPALAGQSVTMTVAVSSAGGTPTGSATVVDADSSASCSATLHAGTTTCTLTFAAAGPHHLTAAYSGDVGFAGSSATTILVVNAASAYTIGGSVSGLAAGSSVVLGLNASAQILPVNANGPFAFPTPLADGASYAVAVQTQPASPVQSCTVSNDSGTVNGGNVVNIIVVCAPSPSTTTTVTLEASVTRAVFGQSVQLVARIGTAIPPAGHGYAAAAAAPSGQVTFADGAVALGSAPVVGGGATFSIASLAVGAHGLTATYSGDANFAPSTSAPLNLVILAPSPGTTVTAPMLAPSWLAALAAALCLAAAGRARRTNSSTQSIERMANDRPAEIVSP